MEFLRQLTFENDKWTKNFDSFDTVDDILDEDEDVETNDGSESMEEEEEKTTKKLMKSTIRKKTSKKKAEKKYPTKNMYQLFLLSVLILNAYVPFLIFNFDE